MGFRNGRKKSVEDMLKKGHDMTVGELLQLTEAIDTRLNEKGMCSHQIAIVGQMLMSANARGDMEVSGMVSGKDMKSVLEGFIKKLKDVDD